MSIPPVPIPSEINHYPVLSYATLGTPEEAFGLVLCYRPEDDTYITWKVWYNLPYGWCAEHGNYEMDWLSAREDFRRRI